MKLAINLSPKSFLSTLSNPNHPRHSNNKKNNNNKHNDNTPNPNPSTDPFSSSFDDSAYATPTSVLSDLPRSFNLTPRDPNALLLSRSHLESLLLRLYPSSSPVELSLMLLDAGCLHCDSVVSIDDLLNHLDSAFSSVGSSSSSSCEAGELREAFDFFDEDRDGRISAKELLGVFRSLGDDRCSIEDCRRMIADVDRDGDGFVCFQEFALMMESQRS
ncbi:hypothetical protein MLD38_004472 [Melastoma candidum]|uniref:Uncharacterized protein n=1 Tax=Melastoma candidum TaxID=119954 RepID=A0ACB9S5T8_9MYRT|nr:hypothetical protein MLD38_004472 [Melastoma candidum]